MWLIISYLLLPTALQYGNALLPTSLSDSKLNFIYYCINFIVVFWIFRQFLKDSFREALRRPFAVLWYAALGYLGCQALSEILMTLVYMILPIFSNVNDQSIGSMLQSDFRLMAIGTVFLVPVAEEALYRGVLFRGFYEKSPIVAYLASMVLFAAIHVVGYIGYFQPLHLLLCFVQYLPAGFCLCWCYRQTGTIITPMLMHTIVNAMSVSEYVR